MKLENLIDTAKLAVNADSDRAFAKHMRVSHGTISHWRNGRAYPDPVSCERLAGLTGTQLVQIIAMVGEARAISREEKAVWRKVAATVATLCLAFAFSMEAKEESLEIQQVNQHLTNASICIMRNAAMGRSRGTLDCRQAGGKT